MAAPATIAEHTAQLRRFGFTVIPDVRRLLTHFASCPPQLATVARYHREPCAHHIAYFNLPVLQRARAERTPLSMRCPAAGDPGGGARGGGAGARSHCRFALLLTRFMPDLLTGVGATVPLSLYF